MNNGDDNIKQLLHYMHSLRDPEQGCPWSQLQNYDSLTQYTLEEVYEVIDAIEQQDYQALRSELGDLLYQIVFYAQIASEAGHFNFDDIAKDILTKQQQRNPRANADHDKLSATAVKQRWEQLKIQQKSLSAKTSNSALDDIPVTFPALIKAGKLQKKAAIAGFDWQNIDEIFDKLTATQQALLTALHTDQDNAQVLSEEIGDLLFTCVNIARHCQIDAETALRKSNEKFTKRFQHLEQQLTKINKSFLDCDHDEIRDYWQQAKIELKSKI